MSKKTFLSRSAAIAMSAVLLSSSMSAYAVSDISNHWAKDNIQKFIDAGIINGYQDDTFRPDNNMTRAEFATILSKLLDDPNVPTEHRYTDVPENAWYFDAVQKLCTLQIVSEDEKFNPQNNVTREQVMVMLARAMRLTATDTTVVNKFSDADKISDYALNAVAAFVEKGYTNGYEDGTIRPKNNITRAECVKLIDSLNLVPDADSLEGIMKSIYKGVTAQIPATDITTITADNVQYYLGLKTMDGIEEAIASEPMISSAAHSVCLVRVKDGTDVTKMMNDIKENVNPQKWICVGVDPKNVMVANQGNLILLVMDDTAPQGFVDSFNAIELGGDTEEKPEEKPEQDKPVVTADGLIQYNDFYMDSMGTINTQYVTNFASKIESISNEYLKDAANIYYAVIPSKQYFINDKVETPFDYTSMMNIIRSGIKSAKEIDLTGTLELEDYLKTDPHWKQEGLQEVLNTLGKTMGFTVDLSTYTKNSVPNFTGQHGYKKENFAHETMTYLTNDAINNAVVDNFVDKTFTKVYNTAKLESDTPYDMFLSGPTPLITITNESAKTDKELVMFRDSYACSLAPLLIENYKTITLVDLRYMASSLLPQHVDFTGKDVLFMYNDQIINTVVLK